MLTADRGEFALKVLALVPLSFLGSLLRPSIRVSTRTATAFATALLVEAYQTTQPERMAAHSDVVANTAGAVAGAIAAWLVIQPFMGRDDR